MPNFSPTSRPKSSAWKRCPAPAPGSSARSSERTEQLLRFTGANSPAEFDAKVECNEEWVQAEAFERGWAEGRAQASREIVHGVHRHN